MARVNIGRRSVLGRLDLYAKRFDLVEVRPDPAAPIRPSVLKKWRESVPAAFVFSVVLPPIVGELRGDRAASQALEHSLEVARILQSPVMLVATPPSVTPTTSNRKKLQELIGRIPNDVVRIAWEPSGLWELEDARAVAAACKVVLVGDAAREPLAPGSVAYTRLRGLGDSRRLSARRLDAVVESLRGRRDVFVVIETDGAVQVARSVREALLHGDASSPRAPRQRAAAMPLAAEDEEQE